MRHNVPMDVTEIPTLNRAQHRTLLAAGFTMEHELGVKSMQGNPYGSGPGTGPCWTDVRRRNQMTLQGDLVVTIGHSSYTGWYVETYKANRRHGGVSGGRHRPGQSASNISREDAV